MPQVTITLPDGSTRQVDAGTTVLSVAREISPRLADAALAGKVNDRLVDL
jgi:threonyl-tRNA synthetase